MLAPILSSLIFVGMFVLIVLEKFERHHLTLVSGGLTLVVVFGLVMRSWTAVWETLSLSVMLTPDFWYHVGDPLEESGINWSTILFIAGMMIMVECMAESGFFKWLCMVIAKTMHYRAIRIFVAFMALSALLSMFIDSITVILFLAAITIELGRLLGFNPVPMILAEVFCANLGGSATMCGDPPNVIIGTSFGYTFGDFITNTGVIAGISFVIIVVYFVAIFGKSISSRTVEIERLEQQLDPANAITDKKHFGSSIVVFFIAVLLLVTHAQTGLTVATIGVIVAALSLLVSGRKSVQIITQVDYKTLLFFIGLFIVVSGLEKTGVLAVLADLIAELSGGNQRIMIAVILILSAVASAFVDNIPFAATMIPVIRALAETQGVPLPTLAWTLAIGTDIGGSATPIGASANVVGLAVASKNGHHISWSQYCKPLVPATVIVIGLSLIYLYIRYL